VAPDASKDGAPVAQFDRKNTMEIDSLTCIRFSSKGTRSLIDHAHRAIYGRRYNLGPLLKFRAGDVSESAVLEGKLPQRDVPIRLALRK
jgi:hypothetical protein